MKKVLITLLVAVLGISLNSCSSNTNKKENTIIKKEKIYHYKGKDKFGELVKGDLELVQITEYDEKGYLISQSHYDHKGENQISQQYITDENGNLIKWISKIAGISAEVYKNEEGKWITKALGIEMERSAPEQPKYIDYIEELTKVNKEKISNNDYSQITQMDYEVEYTEYDKKGNWVKCTLKRLDEVIFIEREIIAVW